MPRASSTIPSARERSVALALILAHALLRTWAAFHHEVNTDEPQHLHVAWAWTQGLVQYRDVFDNHAPLFHLLSAPLVSLFGERADIVVLMRLAMIPLVGATMLATYGTVKRLFGARVALWSVAACWLWPSFVTASIEYRADVLWMFFWSLALWALFARPWNARDSFFAGVFVGLAFATSMKTSLLAVTFLGGVGLAFAVARSTGLRMPIGYTRRILCAALGLVIVPTIIVIAFARLDALDALVQGVVRHNLGAQPAPDDDALVRMAVFPLALPLIWLETRRTLSRNSDGVAFARAVFFASTALYVAALFAFWPMLTRQDYLPVQLALAALATAWIVELVERVPATPIRARVRVAALVLLGVALTARMADAIAKNTRDLAWKEREFLADVLKRTRRTDVVFDLKGECIFRERGYRPVLESITRRRIASGALPDDCAAELTAARAVFAIRDDASIPPSGRAFLDAHFVPAGELRVLGTRLDPAGANDESRSFHVAFSARFELVGHAGTPIGVLDGTLWTGPRELAAGDHTYIPSPQEGLVALVWADAVERGWRFAELGTRASTLR